MTTPLRTTTLLVAAAATLALAACGRNDARTAGEQLDATIAKTEQAASDAGTKTGSAIAQMADTVGDKVGDAGITASVTAELAKDSALSVLRINVDTANGRVSLRGTAPSQLARDRAPTLARSVKGVTAVDNQLDVRG